ncbi:hypothetical protein AGDE_16955 [Angomonas deanei]|nr:hypothetical protein AGDE_16955 [Angomonas deanei]|eukprot:EPY15816.1 hypothetical protein AGDE_16955 [Angomonas deanei]
MSITPRTPRQQQQLPTVVDVTSTPPAQVSSADTSLTPNERTLTPRTTDSTPDKRTPLMEAQARKAAAQLRVLVGEEERRRSEIHKLEMEERIALRQAAREALRASGAPSPRASPSTSSLPPASPSPRPAYLTPRSDDRELQQTLREKEKELAAERREKEKLTRELEKLRGEKESITAKYTTEKEGHTALKAELRQVQQESKTAARQAERDLAAAEGREKKLQTQLEKANQKAELGSKTPSPAVSPRKERDNNEKEKQLEKELDTLKKAHSKLTSEMAEKEKQFLQKEKELQQTITTLQQEKDTLAKSTSKSILLSEGSLATPRRGAGSEAASTPRSPRQVTFALPVEEATQQLQKDLQAAQQRIAELEEDCAVSRFEKARAVKERQRAEEELKRLLAQPPETNEEELKTLQKKLPI